MNSRSLISENYGSGYPHCDTALLGSLNVFQLARMRELQSIHESPGNNTLEVRKVEG